MQHSLDTSAAALASSSLPTSTSSSMTVPFSSSYPFIRRGLHNTHNTCFLNCVLQCLLHCDAFWSMCCQLHQAIAQVDDGLAHIDSASSSSSSSSATSEVRGIQLHHSHTRNSDVAKVIPITHELLTFAAHFRRKQKEIPATKTSNTEEKSTTVASDPLVLTEASTATPQVTAPLSAAGLATSDSAHVHSAEQLTVHSESLAPPLTALTIDSSPTSVVSTSDSTPSSTTNATRKPRKKPAGGDKDLAFLESLAAAAATPTLTAEEEEKRRAKNRKKKEKEREKMKEKAAMAEQAAQPGLETKEPEPVKASPPAAAPADSHSTEAPTTATESTAPLNARQRRLLKKQQQAAALPVEPAALAAIQTHEETNGTADHAASANSTPSSNALSKKQARVHRVEDEEDFTLPVTKASKKTATTPASKAKSSAAAASSSASSTPAASPASATSISSSSSSSVTALSSLPALGPATTTTPFLPNFNSLLHAFKSHHLGQQEDAQELLHILCDSVQTEWTKWNPPTASSSSAAQDDSADWSEVGKGSRAIRVVSNLSFASSPLSRLFCGRIRSQLTVANRATDTMSFQPFYAIHLDIDEAPTSDYLPSPVKKKRASKKQMSIEKAFDRYMCPSEISGYRKRGAAEGTETRARHMHALDSHALPKILVLHLKRFEQITNTSPFSVSSVGSAKLVKSSKHIVFNSSLHLPPRYLGASETLAAAGNAHGASYTLVGIVVHHGHSMSGGHYTSYVRDRELEKKENKKVEKNEKQSTNGNHQNGKSKGKQPSSHKQPLRSSFDDDDDESDSDEDADRSQQSANSTPEAQEARNREIWYHCDDSRVTPVPSHTVYAQAAYLLFYTLDPQETFLNT